MSLVATYPRAGCALIHTVYISDVPTVTRRPRGSLTPDEVIVAASELIDDSGVSALSMRRLAERLGVNPMTLYSRFANREELLGAVIGRRLEQVLDDPADNGAASSIEDRLVAWAGAVRGALVGLGPLIAELRTGPAVGASIMGLTESGLAAVVDAGLDGPDAVAAFRSLFWHAVGFSVMQPQLWAHAPALLDGVRIDDATHPHLARLAPDLGDFDADELFERTTRALVVGLLDDARHQGEPT